MGTAGACPGAGQMCGRPGGLVSLFQAAGTLPPQTPFQKPSRVCSYALGGGSWGRGYLWGRGGPIPAPLRLQTPPDFRLISALPRSTSARAAGDLSRRPQVTLEERLQKRGWPKSYTFRPPSQVRRLSKKGPCLGAWGKDMAQSLGEGVRGGGY